MAIPTPHSLLSTLNGGKFTVGIFGSAVEPAESSALSIAKELGAILGSMGLNVATGGCLGLPAVVAQIARAAGAQIFGFFPDTNEDEVVKNGRIHANDIESIYDIKYYAQGYTKRSLDMIQNIDCAIVVGGRIGTLSEWTIALEEGLPVLVLSHSGGIASHLKHILSIAKKEFPDNYISFSDDVVLSVTQLISSVDKNKLKRIQE